MANARRGEIEAVIDGRAQVLCLTLGALAELETAFAVDNLAALAQRFATGKLAARDLIRVIGAGLRGGGASVSDDEVAAMQFDGGVAGCAQVVGALLAITFGTAERAPADP